MWADTPVRPVDFDPAEVCDAHVRTGASPVPRSEASGIQGMNRKPQKAPRWGFCSSVPSVVKTC